MVSRDFTSIPLLGRSFSQALYTLPGVGPMNSADSAVSVFNPGRPLVAAGITTGVVVQPSLFGQRARSSTTTVDGAVTMYPQGGFSGINPPPEGISEMKVEIGTDSGSGNTSFVSGATINVVTKAGTNEYHGDIWEYHQNSGTRARNFFDPFKGTYQWNQFGFAGGGPLAIPHIVSKEKAWYVFGWYEGIRTRNQGPTFAFVPTAAQRNGDFSADQPIYNPYTSTVDANGITVRQPFPGNRIPMGPTQLCAPQPTCVDPAAVAIASLYPLPNSAGQVPGVNFIGAQRNHQIIDQWSARVDHQFGSKDSFFSRYTDVRLPNYGSAPPAVPQTTYIRYSNVMASDTHIFSPTLVLTTRFSVFKAVEHDEAIDSQQLLLSTGLDKVFPPFHGTPYLPNMSIQNFSGFNVGGGITGPQYYITGSGDVQKISGRHTIAFGGNWLRMSGIADSTTRSEGFNSLPTSNFGINNLTGNSFASFWLGLPSSANTIVGSARADVRSYSYGMYVQDNFRATPKVTINYGLRWDIAPAPVNLLGSGTFSWEKGIYYWDKTNPLTGEAPNIRRGLFPTYYDNLSPRFGIAYALTPKTTVRAAFGIFYNTQEFLFQMAQANRGNWPYSFPGTVTNRNLGFPDAHMVNPFPSSFTSPLAPPTTCNQCIETDPDSTQYGYSQEWSLSVQRQLTPSTLLELNYIGSHSVHLQGQIIANTAATPGLGPITLRQRNPNFRPFTNNWFNVFPAFYDAFVVQLKKRYSNDLSLTANYTWGKAIGYMDSAVGGGSGAFGGGAVFRPSYYNRNDIRGPLAFDVRHRAVATYVYDIPVRSTNRFLKAVVGGWAQSSILTVDSGFPYWIVLPFDNENTGGGVQFPNISFNPTLNQPTIERWFDTSAYQLPVFGTRGNAGKHALFSDGQFNWDASLSKKWPFGKERNVEFRSEFFNLLNNHTFNSPGASFGSPTFGKVNGTRQKGRVIQFALKIHF